MVENGYNGWSNWDTWNVALWMTNEESNYKTLKETFRWKDPQKMEETELHSVLEEIFPSGRTPDGATVREANSEEIRGMICDLLK